MREEENKATKLKQNFWSEQKISATFEASKRTKEPGIEKSPRVKKNHVFDSN